jgi:hypothetical protein
VGRPGLDPWRNSARDLREVMRRSDGSCQSRLQRSQLEHLSFTKSLAPVRRVDKSFNRPLQPEVLDEAMNQASRRI